MAPQIGQPGQFITAQGEVLPGVIYGVNSASNINARKTKADGSVSATTSIEYVQVGGTAPAGVAYFQEIALA